MPEDMNPTLHRFRSILVFQDTTRPPGAALNQAVKLARTSSASLKIVDVIREMPPFLRDFWPAPASAMEHAIATRTAKLRELEMSLQETGIEAKTALLKGRPFVEIVREVLLGNHDLLMKDAFANSSRLFLGSLDQRLITYCPKPVWLLKPHAPTKSGAVVAALDPEVNHRGERLNQKIVKLASSICHLNHASLSVISVWQAPLDLLEAGEEYRVNYAHFRAQIEAAAKATVDHALSSSVVDVPKARIQCVEGLPNDTIVEYVDHHDFDLLVMGTVARTGIVGLLIGNTAEKVFRQVRCSVLAVKPDGFISPLEAELNEDGIDPSGVVFA